MLLHCGHLVDWGVLNQDCAWLALLEDDFRWMWHQLQGATHLHDPCDHIGEWLAIVRHHRSYWKRLIRRASEHACRQRQREQNLITFHKGIFTFLTSRQFTSAETETTLVVPPTADTSWGCMACQMGFRSKGGEGAHMHRVHRQCNPVRQLFQGTQCSSCLKEYHTAGKLKAHLLRATHCRQFLVGAQYHFPPIPGSGSKEDTARALQHDRLLPPLQAEGPCGPAQILRDFDATSWDLHDACCLAFLDFTSTTDMHAVLSKQMTSFPVSWTTCLATMATLKQTVKTHRNEEAFMDIDVDSLLRVLEDLGNPEVWPFLRCQQPSAEGARPLGTWEQMIYDLEPPENWPIPRQFGVYRIVLHAFSGRRRIGDFQFYLDELIQSSPAPFTIITVSLDIIVDNVRGNIADPDVRAFWFHSISQGWTVALLAGPPCETWSRARGVRLHSTGPRAPRVIRDADDLWGFPHLRLRELDQIEVGNLLLCFTAEAFVRLADTGGYGVVEHPKEPEDDASLASIWKLPLFLALRQLPGVELLSISQGLLGAVSMKPTGLLCLNLPGMPRAILQHQLAKNNPKKASIGKGSNGHWATGALKEYPPAMSKALATQFWAAISARPITTDLTPDEAFLAVCREMTVTTYTAHFGKDFAG